MGSGGHEASDWPQGKGDSRGTQGTRSARALALWVAVAVLAACSPKPEEAAIQEKRSGDTYIVEVNSKAPAFAARTLGGEVVRLTDYVGKKVVLLEFWGIFCKSCIEEMPHIEELHRKYADQGLAVLSVNTDIFSPERIASFLAKAGIHPPYPVLRDPRQEVAKAFGVELLPVTVILDRDGWIRLYQEGYKPGDEARFEAKVASLLRQKAKDDLLLAPRGGVTAFAPAGIELVQPGDRVGPLTGETLDGVPLGPGGKGPRLFVFWSLYCAPCRAEYPAVAALYERYRARGLEAYSVNVDTAALEARVRKFAATQPGLPCLADDPDRGGPLAAALGVRATPSLVLLDREGTVVHSESGTSDLAAAEERIRKLLGGE